MMKPYIKTMRYECLDCGAEADYDRNCNRSAKCYRCGSRLLWKLPSKIIKKER